jgi:tetratricopeptide (TPR) repeat protein
VRECKADFAHATIGPIARDTIGAKNYPEAIRLHREVLRKHPENALAHYHLGFAEGMVGNKTQELNEYRRAAALGLSSWDLFLNTGLALFENGSLDAATDALRLAVRLAPKPSRAAFQSRPGLRTAGHAYRSEAGDANFAAPGARAT